MGGTWGDKIKLTIFGESHGEAIGITIDGLPAGIKLDLNEIKREMKRRSPGKSKLETPRIEGDEFNIVSGYFNERTSGSPLTMYIKNSNTKGKDYEELKYTMRPSHSDYGAHVKYNGYNDYRGGGHFSGRLTAPIVFAGAICKQILSEKNIIVTSHIKSIKSIEDISFNEIVIDENILNKLHENPFPLINEELENEMKACILNARENGDSVGGIVECAVLNVPPGIGDPFFNSIESKVSSLAFSIPGVKGIEFGDGFNITNNFGSKKNDSMYIEENKVYTKSNNNGGIVGGISNGMPIIYRVALKPTPSISIPQESINIKNNENTILKVTGRHDPTIVLRAVPVIEAIGAIALTDLILYGR